MSLKNPNVVKSKAQKTCCDCNLQPGVFTPVGLQTSGGASFPTLLPIEEPNNSSLEQVVCLSTRNRF